MKFIASTDNDDENDRRTGFKNSFLWIQGIMDRGSFSKVFQNSFCLLCCKNYSFKKLICFKIFKLRLLFMHCRVTKNIKRSRIPFLSDVCSREGSFGFLLYSSHFSRTSFIRDSRSLYNILVAVWHQFIKHVFIPSNKRCQDEGNRERGEKGFCHLFVIKVKRKKKDFKN